MRRILTAFCLSALIAGPALAADPTVPEAIARATVMKEIARNSKLLGDMAGGKSAFDAGVAAEAKAALIAASEKVTTDFATEGADDPVSEAKPEIWTGWEDFTAKSAALTVAATALDTSSAETVKAGMAGVGGSCKACHSVYRE